MNDFVKVVLSMDYVEGFLGIVSVEDVEEEVVLKKEVVRVVEVVVV